eukprot:11454785-Prorocentrum_lima.AAC.1
MRRLPRCSRLQFEHKGALAASGRSSWLKRVVAPPAASRAALAVGVLQGVSFDEPPPVAVLP